MNLPVGGTGHTPSTPLVQSVGKYEQSGHVVQFIDTPGFTQDCGPREVLGLISSYLEDKYQDTLRLTGVILIHSIHDEDFYDLSENTLRTIRNLCGQYTLQSLKFVTNMWTREPTEAEKCQEREMKTNVFAPAMKHGANFYRYPANGSHKRARKIMASILGSLPSTRVHEQQENITVLSKAFQGSPGNTVNNMIREQEDVKLQIVNLDLRVRALEAKLRT